MLRSLKIGKRFSGPERLKKNILAIKIEEKYSLEYLKKFVCILPKNLALLQKEKF